MVPLVYKAVPYLGVVSTTVSHGIASVDAEFKATRPFTEWLSVAPGRSTFKVLHLSKRRTKSFQSDAEALLILVCAFMKLLIVQMLEFLVVLRL